MKLQLLLILLTLSSCASVVDMNGGMAADDWTIFRGSSSLSGYVDRALPDKPTLAWTYDNDVRTVASPIICGGNAYTCDRKGVLRCIGADGKLIRQHDLGTTVEASFVIRDSILYLGRIDGYVNALSLSTGELLWEYETLGQVSASPNIIQTGTDELLLVGSYDNCMYTFSTTTGERLSQFETGYYINGAAAVWHEYMVFGGCDGWLRMVNTLTGMQTDSVQLKAYVPASPAIADGRAYVSDYNGNLYEQTINNDGTFGAQRLLVEIGDERPDAGTVSMPTVSPDAVFVLTGERKLVCIDRVSGKTRWDRMLRGEPGECAPLVCRDRVLVCTKDGHVSIFSATDGKELWHYEVGEQIIASPAVITDGFYIQTSRGKLLRFQ